MSERKRMTSYENINQMCYYSQLLVLQLIYQIMSQYFIKHKSSEASSQLLKVVRTIVRLATRRGGVPDRVLRALCLPNKQCESKADRILAP